MILRDITNLKLITYGTWKSPSCWFTAARKCLNGRQDSTHSLQDKKTFSPHRALKGQMLQQVSIKYCTISLRRFLLKHKEHGKLGEKNWLVAQTDLVPTPLRENGRGKWRVLKKSSPTQPAQIQQRHSSTPSIFPKRTAIRKKSLLYFGGDQNWKKNQTQNWRKKGNVT